MMKPFEVFRDDDYRDQLKENELIQQLLDQEEKKIKKLKYFYYWDLHGRRHRALESEIPANDPRRKLWKAP